MNQKQLIDQLQVQFGPLINYLLAYIYRKPHLYIYELQ